MFRLVFTFMLVSVSVVISGCVADFSSVEAPSHSAKLSGMWQVESINQGGIIDNSMITVEFGDDNRIVGSTGCNRYSGSLVMTDEDFKVSNTISTRKACAPALMMQEQRFLAALNEVIHYKISLDTWLLVTDDANNERLKMIPMAMKP